MAEFIRPEARAVLWRWRDVIVALLIVAIGLWWAIGSFGIVRWLGILMIVLGAVLVFTGTQRARFRQGAGGPGVVQIVERRIGYFGPLTGGALDLDDLTVLELDPDAHPDPHWILTGVENNRVAIPVTAKGAEALFDAFASLPGIRTETMLSVLERTPDQRVVIWRKTQPLLH
ncbi:hypothetical protein [Yoonia sp. 208BN28-4]|uniref:hypothetical protein n=1 Tax=Yoonia sp. 208BN28-4 TaxID=3126505 RepID=UPI0030A3283E